MGDETLVELAVDFPQPVPHPQFGLFVHASDGTPILDLRTRHNGPISHWPPAPSSLSAKISELNLYPGEYLLSAWMTDATSTVLDWVEYLHSIHRASAPRQVRRHASQP